MYYILLLSWVFFITMPSREMIMISYHWKDDCEYYQRIFERVHAIEVTKCKELKKSYEEDWG
jgi:hypothetical protein